MIAITTRAARADDEALLYRMLALAASMDASDASVAAARSDPMLRGYVEGFGAEGSGREGDLGIVALRGDAPVGAAWLRLLPATSGEPQPGKLWTREVPELAIATDPSTRGEGVGTRMMRELVDRARGRYPAIVLSVRAGNPAVRLYDRLGFVVEREIVNRVGGVSFAMRLALR